MSKDSFQSRQAAVDLCLERSKLCQGTKERFVEGTFLITTFVWKDILSKLPRECEVHVTPNLKCQTKMVTLVKFTVRTVLPKQALV